MSLSIILFQFCPIGIRQKPSPLALPDATISLPHSVEFVNRPAASSPNEITIAPVSVAKSMIRSGSYSCCTNVSTSPSTRRPSASVFKFSTVIPDSDVTTSPGLIELPSGMFSTRPTIPTTLREISCEAMACIAPTTAPEPPISYFISPIPADGLIEIPPVSNVTPLPTSASGFSSPPSIHSITTTYESFVEP